MTRPLLEKTIVELGAMADRNRTNRAELHLIRAELRHRSTPKAQLLAKRVYGNQMVVTRSEYEGRVEATGERFLSHDIHAAVREVARRAQATVDVVA